MINEAPVEPRKKILNALIKLSYDYAQGKPIQDGALERIRQQHGKLPQFLDLYGHFIQISREAISSKEALAIDIVRDQMKSLRLSNEILNDIISTYQHLKSNEINIIEPERYYLKLKQMKWRINITISSSYLLKVMEPCILMELIFENESRYIFEVSISKFHELRFNVATLLKEMEMLEKRKLLKNQ